MSDREAESLQRNIAREANDALRTGTYPLALFTIVCTVALFGFSLSTPHMRPPAIFIGLCAVYLVVMFALAKQQRFQGPLAWVVLLSFCTAPSIFFYFAELMSPSGAMTYLFGPISTLYLILIVFTGFMLDWRLSTAAGVVGGISYFLVFLMARPRLAELHFPSEAMTQEMTAPLIHLFKSVVMVGTGLLVAALGTSAKRLVTRSVDETREREKMSRLFGEYVSDAVRDQLLRQLSDARGERAQVAVLFSDLRGFTTFSETLAPQELVERLNEYFDLMVGAIRQNGGRVDKFIGDAVMAVFGGLMPLDNPSESAVAAALDMRKALAVLNARWQAQGRTPIDNGIGVHFGDVLQGPMGSKDRKEFAVIGDVVNTASRLESATKELGQAIVISKEVHAALGPERQRTAIDLGEAKLKGKEHAVRVWGIPS